MNLSIFKTHLVSGDTFTSVKKNSYPKEAIFTTALKALVMVLFRTRLQLGKSPDPDPPRTPRVIHWKVRNTNLQPPCTSRGIP